MDFGKLLTDALKRADTKAFHSTAEKLEGNRSDVSLEGETFRNLQLYGFDLRDFNLSNTEWENCILENVNAANTILEGAYLHECSLVSCRFDDTNLEGAAFESCVLKNSSFIRTNVCASEFSTSQFDNCTLRDLILEDIEWDELIFNNGQWINIKGQSGSLNNSTLRSVIFRNVDTSSCDISHSHISNPLDGSQQPAGFSIRAGRRKRV